ncbi:CoA-binding protein [Hahella sp. NBU794]|uniref:CoA-binding protein n=1 Tax=Hahella sp. NBU794 TaxID=3422590 RepID=UPI003D6EA685
MPSAAEISRILKSVHAIAMVGASDKPGRDSHHVMLFLQNKGYRVIPVNPALKGSTLLGETVYASLRDIHVPVDMVDIFRRPDAVPDIVDNAIAIGASVVWMQLGVIHEPAAQKAMDAGIKVVMDRCPKIEITRLGL